MVRCSIHSIWNDNLALSYPGVGETTPFLSIFSSPPEALEFYGPFPQNVNESVSSFGRAYAQSQILNNLAVDRAQTVAESVSTPTVALDMFTIMNALGQDKLNYYGISCVLFFILTALRGADMILPQIWNSLGCYVKSPRQTFSVQALTRRLQIRCYVPR